MANLPQDEDVDHGKWVAHDFNSLRPEWHYQARCFSVGSEKYFGEDEDNSITSSIKTIRQASKLCDACPVFSQCLRTALEGREEFGVWAGTSGRMRKRIFTLLDNGDTTVEEVIGAFRDGQGDQYRQAGAGRRGRAEAGQGSARRRDDVQVAVGGV